MKVRAVSAHDLDMRGPGLLLVIWLAAGCGGSNAIVPPAPDLASGVPYKRVFAASAVHDGNLGGPSGGDALCDGAAQAAGLGGAFEAFLGTSAVAAPDRLRGEGPWWLVDGSRMVFADRATLAAGGPSAQARVELTERATASPPGAWTGWSAMYHSDCNGWTSASIEGGGIAGATGGMGGWADAGGVPSCAIAYSIYCFER